MSPSRWGSSITSPKYLPTIFRSGTNSAHMVTRIVKDPTLHEDVELPLTRAEPGVECPLAR